MNESLEEKLLEVKNPMCLVLLGIITSLVVYMKEVALLQLPLILICVVIVCRKKSFLVLASILLSTFYLFLFSTFNSPDLDKYLNERNLFVGEVVSSEKKSLYEKRFFYKIRKIISDDGQEDLNVKVYASGAKYKYFRKGEIIQLKGKLKRPKTSLLPGLFSEKNYLKSKGVRYVLKSDYGTEVFYDFSFMYPFYRFSNLLRNKSQEVNKRFFSDDELNIINGIIYGSRSAKLSKELSTKIRDLGISHITSASGFNVGIISIFLFLIFTFFNLRGLFPSLIVILSVVFYSMLANFSPSILRATALVILFILGRSLNKKAKVLPSLSFILILFFLFNPYSLLDIGLQLSAIAFLGLALFYEEVENGMNLNCSKALNYLISIFLQSFVAQLFVLPLVAFYFHNVQLLGLISNIVAVPIAALILVCGLVDLPIAFIPFLKPLNYLLCKVLAILSSMFISWVDFLGQISLKKLYLPLISLLLLMKIYMVIFAVICFLFLKLNKKVKFLIFIFCCLLFLPLLPSKKSLKIYFVPRYNRNLVLVVKPDKKVFCLSNKINSSDVRLVSKYVEQAGLKEPFHFVDLDRDFNGNNLVCENKKCKLNHETLMLEILTCDSVYSAKDVSVINIPICNNSFHYNLESPKAIIVNDYRRVGASARSVISRLNMLSNQKYFLSRGNTVFVESSDSGYEIKELD